MWHAFFSMPFLPVSAAGSAAKSGREVANFFSYRVGTLLCLDRHKKEKTLLYSVCNLLCYLLKKHFVENQRLTTKKVVTKGSKC